MTAARATFSALGTTAVVVVTEPAALPDAVDIVEAEVGAIDLACSRFRPDSELMALTRARGRPVEVSMTLFDALATALDVAAETDGVVVPTIGAAVRLLGYDRDFGALPADDPAPIVGAAVVPGWRAVRIDPSNRTVSVPPGVELDLGATAKAWCADRAAARVAEATGVGVLVNLGGDLATAGPAPSGGWGIRLAHRHDDEDDRGPIVVIHGGGLATSSTSVRRWRRAGDEHHHIVDPTTGRSAERHWMTVTVAAATCVGANAASTAAIVLGPAACGWLARRGLPARLVHEDGDVVVVGGWPDDDQLVAEGATCGT